jgi:SAM-dependent methyltransferase
MLDVGHGDGAITNHYRSRGVRIVGIEVNEDYVRKASERFPKTKYLWYDGKNFPFEDSTFDTVILNDVLEHISYADIEKVMSEVRRVLIPNGFVYISVMNRWQLVEPHKLIPFLTWLPRITWNPICLRLRNQNYINYWPYTRKRLHSLLEQLKFRYWDLTYIYVTHKILGLNPIGDKITARVTSILKRFHLMIIAYYFALKFSVLLYVAQKT